jgi:DNA-binding transcriptional regulator GbsR (MarR family)
LSEYIKYKTISSNQKALIAGAFVIAFCICLGFLFLSTPVFRVKASILIQGKDIGVSQIDQFTDFNNPEVSNIVQKLRSVSLLEKTLRKLNFNPAPDSLEFLNVQKNLFVRQLPPSNTIEISLTYSNISDATQIVNTLVETLMQDDLKERREQIHQALESIQTALISIQTEQLQSGTPAQKSNRYLIDNYLKEINDDLYKTMQKLLVLKSNLSTTQTDTIDDVFSQTNLARFKQPLTVSEKRLVGLLLSGGWNHPNVKAQLKYIWKEKTKLAATLKEQLNMRTDIPLMTIDDICAYEIRRFDLQIRKQEFIVLKQNSGTSTATIQRPHPSGVEQPYESLKKLEIELIEKQTILQSLNDLTLAKIIWIDKAFPVKSLFRSNILLTFGLSFGIALIAAFITGLLCMEFNSYQKES